MLMINQPLMLKTCKTLLKEHINETMIAIENCLRVTALLQTKNHFLTDKAITKSKKKA